MNRTDRYITGALAICVGVALLGAMASPAAGVRLWEGLESGTSLKDVLSSVQFSQGDNSKLGNGCVKAKRNNFPIGRSLYDVKLIFPCDGDGLDTVALFANDTSKTGAIRALGDATEYLTRNYGKAYNHVAEPGAMTIVWKPSGALVAATAQMISDDLGMVIVKYSRQ